MKTCICTVIKNEHQYLDEWIQYHLRLGIDYIFIFEDIDSDSHKDITDKYDNVELQSINITLNDINLEEAKELKQLKRYNVLHLYLKNALNWIKNNYDYDWCFLIDCDEFITLEDDNLKNVLSLYDDYDAFVLQWKCFGASGYISKPNYTNHGVVDTYTKEISGNIPTAMKYNVKTCYNLKKYDNYIEYSHHYPTNRCKWCNTEYKLRSTEPTYKNIYLRHYITKSWEEYVWKIRERGFTWGKTRTFDFFFELNADLKNRKEEIMNTLPNDVLVVLPYKQSGSQGNEIRNALSLWRKYCTFNYHFVVIGEFENSLKNEFPWVEFIYCQSRERKEGQYNPHLDIQNKYNIVMNMYSKIYSGFIRMTDDNYAIKPFDLNDVFTIHYHSLSFTGIEKCPTSFWKHDKWKTRQLLDKEKLPHINYSTHYLYYFEFSKLKEIWDKFNMRNESYVLEDIYFNYFEHGQPVLDSTIRLGIWNRFIFEHEFDRALKNPNIKFMCNSVEGWSRELESSLMELLNG